MATLDIILIICFVPFFIHGISKGLVAQVFAIGSLLLGAWLSFRFSSLVCERLEPIAEFSPAILHVVAFILIMLVTIVVMNLLGRLLSQVFRLVMLGWLDRLLGLLFALICGALSIGLGILLFDTLNGSIPMVKEEVLEESVLYTNLRAVAYAIFPYMKSLMFKQ